MVASCALSTGASLEAPPRNPRFRTGGQIGPVAKRPRIVLLQRMAKHRCLSDQALLHVARRFAVLSEPMRLRLIQCLFDGELNVSQLVEATGGTQANVSRHLQTLTAANILERRKEGLQVYYRIADPTIPRLCEIVCGAIEKQIARQASHFAQAG